MAVHQCSVCGTPTYETRQTVRFETPTATATVRDVPVHHCPRCGDHEITLSRAPHLRDEIAVALARKEDKLLPREVRFLREYLGLSVGELADTVGTTELAAALWEDQWSSEPMGTQAERLLRVLVLTGKLPPGRA
jgi:YgiT-type zinc finger domain-containing protein